MLKSKLKKSKFQQAKEEAFTERLKDVFDMAHQNAMKMIKIARTQGLSECSEAEGSQMIGVDKVLAAKEERTRLRKRSSAAPTFGRTRSICV